MTPPEESPHDFIEAELAVEGLAAPADEVALNAALSACAGVLRLTVAAGKVAVEYDPVQVSEAELAAAIARAGYRVTAVEGISAEPINDALHHQPPEPP